MDDLLDLPLSVVPTAPLLRRGWRYGTIHRLPRCYVALAETLDYTLLTTGARLAKAPRLALHLRLCLIRFTRHRRAALMIGGWPPLPVQASGSPR
ncbi:MAG TPA: hypothetical protein VGR26_01995 [Acidimicrobiales bacterium]|nr:hypothetical protein [Acidimicrobiales bacterium]